jgi:hypothetical protein
VTEVLYSIFRKMVLRRMSVTKPDRLHLHMLVYRRCIRHHLRHRVARPWVGNAAVAALVAPWMAAWTLAVVVLGTSGRAAALLLALHAAAYVAIYLRLLRGGWRFHPAAVARRLARAARARALRPSRVGR